MDPKTEKEATKEIVSEMERFLETDQEAVVRGDVEKAAVSTGVNIQQVSPSSNSSLKRDRASFSAASEDSQIAKVELKRQQAQAKYEEALEKGNQLLVDLWRDVIAQSEKAAEYYQKVAEAAAGNADEEWQWKEAAEEVESSESCLKLAAEAFEKAAIATTQNNLPVATLWQKIAPQYQEEAEYHQKSSEAVATGNAEEMRKVRNILNKYGCDFSSMYLSNQKSEAVKSLREMQRFCHMAGQLHRSIYYLKSAIEALEKATIATTKGTQSVAAAWQQVARTKQKIAELYQQTIKGIEEGDDQDIGWMRAFEEAFDNAEGDEKYYEEQVRRLEEESNAKAAATV